MPKRIITGLSDEQQAMLSIYIERSGDQYKYQLNQLSKKKSQQ
ncbi:MAG: hypothetical protein RMZ41_001420 [Nostoc sp. DedVER02]|nr:MULTISPECIES: hypothetical protein [unclassified Nostoc]MDZ7987178.1 hypothetical protein [Nostoc sp. DedVER02]MDZ8110951.1 hypothetical protein [Nostoc sp. DedVER01b]